MLFNSSNNRNAQHRKDQNFVEKAFQSEQALIVVWYKGKLLIQEHQFELFSFQQINELGVDTQNKIYLASEEPNKENKNNDKTFHYFSINLLNWNDKLNHFELFDLRTASPFLTENILSLLFYAQGLNNWHHNNPFCSQCGSQTEIKQFGHVRQCLNGDCQKEHFPRTDPAVIFTIINKQQKDERILLARQGSWDENRYSVVAGFVEPGESLEDAVRREALEEVGVHVFNVKYQMSQPWPFPASIMLGYTSETKDEEIHLHDQELEKARWFSAQEIIDLVHQGELKLPFTVSISFYLINAWFTEQVGYNLRQLFKDVKSVKDVKNAKTENPA